MKSFQLIRIDPIGGVSPLAPVEVFWSASFQLIRIDPIGGEEGSTEPINLSESFQLIRIDPIGGVTAVGLRQN